MDHRMIEHPISPFYDETSRLLILGSFPSVMSREGMFFYHHPRNRFWAVVAAVMEATMPVTLEEKREFLRHYRIALWDVVKSCRIQGSSDSSIRDVVANDLSQILEEAPVGKIFTNGGTAFRLYEKYTMPLTDRRATKLPSTSPANAAYGLDQLVDRWSLIRRKEIERNAVK